MKLSMSHVSEGRGTHARRVIIDTDPGHAGAKDELIITPVTT